MGERRELSLPGLVKGSGGLVPRGDLEVGGLRLRGTTRGDADGGSAEEGEQLASDVAFDFDGVAARVVVDEGEVDVDVDAVHHSARVAGALAESHGHGQQRPEYTTLAGTVFLLRRVAGIWPKPDERTGTLVRLRADGIRHTYPSELTRRTWWKFGAFDCTQ